MKRGLVLAAAAIAAAGLLLLIAAGRTWGAATTRSTTGARQHVSVTGHAVASSLPALGIALLALSVAILAARGAVRRVLGLLVVVAGAAAVPVAIDAHGSVGRELASRVFGSTARSLDGSRPAWWLLAVASGVIAVVAGAAVVIRGGAWRGLGSRYDAPGATPRAGEPTMEAWDALDHGHDPTVEG
jgi:uncharacterized membrane protein (TIGR02234 family)